MSIKLTMVRAAGILSILFFSFNISSRALAERAYYRIYTDKSGSHIGSSTELPNGQIIYRDRSGKPLGYSSKGSYDNSRIYSDKSGSYRFRETYMKSGNSKIYGRNGKEIGGSTNKNMNNNVNNNVNNKNKNKR